MGLLKTYFQWPDKKQEQVGTSAWVVGRTQPQKWVQVAYVGLIIPEITF